MELPPHLRDNITLEMYEAGHMMYLRRPDLKQANDDVREFIRNTIPAPGEPAKR